MAKLFLTPIVGNFFRPMHCREALSNAKNGTPLMLVRQPDNEFDPYAVAVMLGNLHVGFIGKDLAVQVAFLMSEAGISQVEGKLVCHEGVQSPRVNFEIPSEEA